MRMMWGGLWVAVTLGGCGLKIEEPDDPTQEVECRLVESAEILFEDPQLGAGPVAVHDGTVYFAVSNGDLTSGLRSIEGNGGEAAVLSQEGPTGSGIQDLTADGDGLYWVADSDLMMLRHGTGQSEALYEQGPYSNLEGAFVVDDDVFVFAAPHAGLLKLAKGGAGPVEVLGDRIELGSPAAAFGSSAYVWITRDEDRPALEMALGEVEPGAQSYRTILELEPPSAIVGPHLAADADRLYHFGFNGRELASVPTAGGENEVLLADWPGFAADLHSDGTWLHFWDRQDNLQHVWRMPVDGSVAPEAIGCQELGTAGADIRSMAVGADGVFVSLRVADDDGGGMQILRFDPP